MALECAALKLILVVLGCQIGIGDQAAADYLYQTLVYICAVSYSIRLNSMVMEKCYSLLINLLPNS